MTFSYYDCASDYGYAGTGLRGMLPKFSYLFDLNHFALIGDLIRFALIGYKDLKKWFPKESQLGRLFRRKKI